MLNFDRSTVKYVNQNIQNDCHQLFSGSFRVHQIRFRQRLRPGHTGGTYSSPDPLAGLRALFLREAEWEGRRKGENKGRGREREGPPLLQIPGVAPDMLQPRILSPEKFSHERSYYIALMFFIVIGALQVILTMIMVQKCGEIFLILINYLGHFLFQRLTVYCSYGHFLICLVFTLCSSEHFV